MTELIPIAVVQWLIAALLLIVVASKSIRIIRPTERGLIERLGKYQRFGEPGIKFLIPVTDQIIRVNITEQMVNVDRQQIITKDNLNASVAAQVYFKVKKDEDSVKSSQYNVDDVEIQIVSLAQTTLRNIIGTMTLTDANTKRGDINKDLMDTLTEETSNWGISVVRTELREIDPPDDVQQAMNKVVKAENEKLAAKDLAEAAETEADGKRRAAIKQAEGERQAQILSAEGRQQALVLEADGKAQAIEKVNTAAEKFFVGNAQLLKQLEVTENSLRSNTLIIASEDQPLVNVIGNISGAPLIPVSTYTKSKSTETPTIDSEQAKQNRQNKARKLK